MQESRFLYYKTNASLPSCNYKTNSESVKNIKKGSWMFPYAWCKFQKLALSLIVVACSRICRNIPALLHIGRYYHLDRVKRNIASDNSLWILLQDVASHTQINQG